MLKRGKGRKTARLAIKTYIALWFFLSSIFVTLTATTISSASATRGTSVTVPIYDPNQKPSQIQNQNPQNQIQQTSQQTSPPSTTDNELLSISLEDPEVILEPTPFANNGLATKTTKIEIATTNPTGATLSVEMDASTPTGELIGASDSNNKIPSTAAINSATLNTNSWGVYWNHFDEPNKSNLWRAIPNNGNKTTIFDKDDESLPVSLREGPGIDQEGTVVIELTFGVKIDINMKPDSYKGSILYTATTNEIPGVLPEARNGDIMQEIGISKSCPRQRTWVVDARDNRTYWVRLIPNTRAGFGHADISYSGDLCWMQTNLAYQGGGANTYGDVKNLIVGDTLHEWIDNENLIGLVNDWSNYPGNNHGTLPTIAPNPPATISGAGGQYGYYYNWCGAMGGPEANPLACTYVSSGNANYDKTVSVCPAGWRLPTVSPSVYYEPRANNYNEFWNLNQAVNGGLTNTDIGLRDNWLGVYAGLWYPWGNFNGVGTFASFWSSHNSYMFENYDAHQFMFGANSSYPVSSVSKDYGLSVRCVKEEGEPSPPPPIISNPAPANGSSFPSGTTAYQIGIRTNVSAECRYSTFDTDYDSMTNSFTQDWDDDDTNHIAGFGGLTNGTTYTIYARCKNRENNITNQESFSWTFRVKLPYAQNGHLMQDIGTRWDCPINRTWVADARDNKTYWVQEIANTSADGTKPMCWMQTNLAYAGGTANGGNNSYGDVRNLTIADTDAAWVNNGNLTPLVRTNFANTSFGNQGVAFTVAPTPPKIDTQFNINNPNRQSGFHYNFCALYGAQSNICTASTGTPNYNISVCPAGWRLATVAGATGEFGRLNTAINGGLTNTNQGLRENWLATATGMIFATGTTAGQFINVSGAYYWGQNGSAIAINPTSVNLNQGWQRPNAAAVRCVHARPGL